MQTTSSSAISPTSASLVSTSSDTASAPRQSAYAGYQIIRRNGAVVSFEPTKIAVALMKAFLAVHGTQGAASASVRETVDALTENVVRALMRSRPGGGTFPIEDVQDQVELGLMRGGHHEIARAYVLYRERRTQERAQQKAAAPAAAQPTLMVIDRGQRKPLDLASLQALIEAACRSVADVASQNRNQLEIHIAGGSLFVATDAKRLLQVLRHVIDNACKFTTDGKVTVSAGLENASNGRRLIVQIFDTGRGMSALDLQRLFQPFEQMSQGPARTHEGAGLGLAITQRLMALLGGSIAVKSEPGQGTQVTLSLPAASH